MEIENIYDNTRIDKKLGFPRLYSRYRIYTPSCVMCFIFTRYDPHTQKFDFIEKEKIEKEERTYKGKMHMDMVKEIIRDAV